MSRVLSDTDKELLIAVNKGIIAIVSGAQSYRIGSRSLTRADLPTLLKMKADLEGTSTMKFRQIAVVDT